MRFGHVWFGMEGNVWLGEDSCVRFRNGRQGKVGLGLVGRGMDCLVVIWKGMAGRARFGKLRHVLAMHGLAGTVRLVEVMQVAVRCVLLWFATAGYKNEV